MAIHAADAWQQSGPRPDRPSRAARVERSMVAERPARPRGSAPRRDAWEGAPRSSRPPVPRRPSEPSRPVDRHSDHDRGHGDRRPTPGHPRGGSSRAGGRSAPAADTGGSRLRGLVAVGAVFLVTLAGAAVDSFVGIGLGMITLVALVLSSATATLLVRRRDLVSVVVAPPLVFVAVAAVNISLAPSASFSLATIATLLIRGFPTMAVATGVTVVLAIVRLAARR
jgi:hypothetical protein